MITNLKNALPFIAGALASKQGVKVLQGDWAKTNCVDTIWLPPLPDNDPDVTVLALGFVGHEAGHISFTDTEVSALVKKQKNPETFFGMMNLLEDIRMEKLQKARFPGVSSNLDKLFISLVDKKIYGVPDESDEPIKIVQGWMINKLRFDILHQAAFKDIAEGSDVVFEKTLPLNARIRLEALSYDVDNAKSTLDVFHLTSEIMKMIEDEAEKERENEDQEQQAKSSSAQSQSGDASDDADDGDNSSGDSSSQSKQDGDSNPVNGSGGAGDSDNDDQAQKMSEILKSILGAAKEHQYQDLGDVLADQINVESAKTPRDYDGSGPLRVFNATKHANKGSNSEYDFQARRAVNALKQKLQTVLQAQTFSSTTRTDKGARFSQRHLHEVKLGGKVFEKRAEGMDIDVAASLLIDISPSMDENNKLKIAALTGYATAEALASIQGVTTAVAVFPTATGVDYLTSFGTKPAANAESFKQLKTQGSTPLSDSMARVAIDLIQQPQARKLLIVVTDGEPNNDDQSKQVIAAAANAGVEILGVGIGVVLNELFTTWCTINSVDDLPKAMFGMLQNKLTYKIAA